MYHWDATWRLTNTMTYVTSYMKKELANHVLEPAKGNNIEALAHRMIKPGTNIYSAYLSEIANRICIAGDICLGGNENGIVSTAGYNLAWFAGQLSECYLCEKFLRQEWKWVVAVEEIQWQIKEAAEDMDGWWTEHADQLKKFIKDPGWKYDTPTIEE